MDPNKNNEPLASEMYADLKETNFFLRKILVRCFVVILVLVAGIIGTNIYHIYKWSMFDTVVVDSDQGPANYVHGDNTGGIYNGPDYSAEAPDREIQGN